MGRSCKAASFDDYGSHNTPAQRPTTTTHISMLLRSGGELAIKRKRMNNLKLRVLERAYAKPGSTRGALVDAIGDRDKAEENSTIS